MKGNRFSFIVAIFTIVLAVATCVQVWAFIQSERAFLSITGFQFEGGLAPNKPIVLIFGIRNSGRSAAIIHDFNLTISPQLTNPRQYESLSRIAVNPIVAGAAGQHVFEAKTLDDKPRILSEADVNSINNGQANFYVFGFIKFEDEFSWFGSRRIEFCYLYIPQRSVPSASAFGGCPIKN